MAEKQYTPEEIKALVAENTALKSSVEQLNASLAEAETSSSTGTTVTVSKTTYTVLVPKCHYEGSIVETAKLAKSNKEFADFAIKSGMLAEEGDVK